MHFPQELFVCNNDNNGGVSFIYTGNLCGSVCDLNENSLCSHITQEEENSTSE